MNEEFPETANETTQQLADLIIGVRHLEAKAERARLAAEAAAEAARKRPHRQTARKPMATTEAYVAVATAVCLLLAFVAYLYFSH